MSEIYNTLKEFWNGAYAKLNPKPITTKSITEESFNNLINNYLSEATTLLDYGCGAGWAIFDIAKTIYIEYGLGIDTSKNAIEYNNKCKELSKIENIFFECGDENKLDEINKVFDAVVSFNVIDVLPSEVVESILTKIKIYTKKDGIIILGINPDYPIDMLEKSGCIVIDGCLYKDGVFRGSLLSDETWINTFKKHFEFISLEKISVVERERAYPRRVFVLKNTKK